MAVDEPPRTIDAIDAPVDVRDANRHRPPGAVIHGTLTALEADRVGEVAAREYDGILWDQLPTLTDLSAAF